MKKLSIYDRNRTIFGYMSMFGITITIASIISYFFVPLFSYKTVDLTTLELTEETISIFKMTLGAAEDSVRLTLKNGFIWLTYTLLLCIPTTAFLDMIIVFMRNDKWKEKINQLTLGFFVCLGLYIIGFVMTCKLENAFINEMDVQIPVPLEKEFLFFLIAVIDFIPLLLGGVWLVKLYLAKSRETEKEELAPVQNTAQEINNLEHASEEMPVGETTLVMEATEQERTAEERGYTVILKDCGTAKKITLMRVIMKSTGMSLAEAKHLVENLGVVLYDVCIEDAEELIIKMEDAGAIAEIV